MTTMKNLMKIFVRFEKYNKKLYQENKRNLNIKSKSHFSSFAHKMLSFTPEKIRNIIEMVKVKSVCFRS